MRRPKRDTPLPPAHRWPRWFQRWNTLAEALAYAPRPAVFAYSRVDLPGGRHIMCIHHAQPAAPLQAILLRRAPALGAPAPEEEEVASGG